MNQLPRIIGPAPSELPPDALIIRVRTERNRVREALARFKARPIKRSGGPRKKGMSRANMSQLLTETGMSVEELKAMLKGV